MTPLPNRRRTLLPALALAAIAGAIPAATITVTSGANSGAGTLREAITNANLDATTDTIVFDGALSAVTLTATLPSISQPLIIDGTVNRVAGVLVEINGTGVTGDGLSISAAGCEVYGLYVRGFSGDGIAITGANATIGAVGKGNRFGGIGDQAIFVNSANATIKGNWIGLNASGNAAESNLGGVVLGGAGGHILGGSAAGERNVIAAATSSNGVNVLSPSCVIRGNYIGTDATGSIDLGSSGHGIYFQNDNTTIGGTGAGEGNVISGNALRGIHGIGGDNAIIVGNIVGLGADGATNIGNGEHGIFLNTSVDNATIAGNTVSRNAGYGIRVEASFGSAIRGNRVGTDSAGNPGQGNGNHGISVVNTGATTPVAAVIGGLVSGDGNIVYSNSGYGIEVNANQANSVLGNRIGANTNNGIRLAGTGGATVQGNIVGLNLAGTAAAPNATGLVSAGSGVHTIGGATAAQRNLVSGNTGAGISIGTAGAIVRGNYVGTNDLGTASIPNTSDGISIGAAGATVAENISSGNGGIGIFVNGAGCIVDSNFVGTNAAGTAAIPNGGFGMRFGTNSDGSFVEGNLVSGNNSSGIVSDAGSDGLSIRGNVVGLNLTQTATIPNIGGNPKVWLFGSNHAVGGPVPGDGNVVGGNVGVGILTNATGTLIQGNYVGTNTTFASGLGNTSHGIQFNNTATGGQVLGNVICANAGQGIRLNIGDTIIRGNHIGTSPALTAGLGNTGDGVLMNTGPGASIGGIGAGEGNVIANNGGNGVIANSGVSGSRIIGNTIYGNAGLGIALGAATLHANDALDADTGANRLQNYPLIGPTATNATTISGSFAGAPSIAIAVHAYANSECDPSGFGEGRTYLGTTMVSTDASGFAPWTVVVGSPLASGTILTATATDVSTSATSMFSACVPVSNDPAPTVLSIERAPAAPNPIVAGDIAEFAITFTEPVTGLDPGDLSPRETGALSGSSVTTVTLLFGNHATFDGASDMFEVPSGSAPNLAGSSYSWEFWCNRAAIGTDDTVFTLGSSQSTNNLLNVGFIGTTFRFSMFSNDLNAPFADPRTNRWTHFAGTYDAATNVQSLYMDGALVATRTAGADFAGTGPLRISNTAFNPFNGSIDELRIWNVVRTPAEIAGAMHDKLTGAESGLVAYFDFDGFEDLAVNADGADDLRDLSANAAHADAFGAPALAATGVRGATAIVTAVAGVGSGTLGLDVAADGSIRNGSDFPLTSPVTGSGQSFLVAGSTNVPDWQLSD